jgi:hypothetical protein
MSDVVWELVGWGSTVCFAICGLPLLIRVWRTKSVDDISVWFLVLWLGGEGMGMAYALARAPRWPLYANYGWCALVTFSILVLWFKYRRIHDVEGT